MSNNYNQNASLGSTLADFAKDIGSVIVRAFGRILGIGIAAGVVGGIGGGLAAAIYGLPIIGFAIGGAVFAVIAVYAIWLLAMSDH